MPPFWLRRLHQVSAHCGWLAPFHSKSLPRAAGERPIVLVRVDDYPRWDRPLKEFLAFDNLLRRYRVSYAVGVTPFLRIPPRSGQLDSAEVEVLRQLVDRGVTVALHGFTHLPHRWGRRHTVELPAYSSHELVEWMDRADRFFDRVGVPRPEILIPPFDGITAETFRLISNRYRIVTGGPASLTTLGPVSPGVRLHQSVYLPSYYPHMYATRLFPLLGRRLWTQVTSLVVVITFHWAWEVRDGYRRLESLLSVLSADVSPWEEALRRFAEQPSHR